MNALHTAVIGVTIAVNAYATYADFARVGFVLKTADEVHVDRSWLPTLGVLKGAGVLGLLLGLFGIPFVGTAAAAGLTTFFVGAVIAHLRARVFYNILAPIFFLALATVSLVMLLRDA